MSKLFYSRNDETSMFVGGGISLLNKSGYDPFIDFLKGMCILFVLLQHCLPETILDKFLFCFWGNQAVPLFLILQAFHAFKHGINKVSYSYRKIYQRIIKPFMVVLIILFAYLVVYPSLQGADFFNKTQTFLIYGGGPAPGSYFVWVYLQMAVVIVLCSKIMAHLNKLEISIFFILISIILELLCSGVEFSPEIYRLLSVRYFYLIWIGYSLCMPFKITSSFIYISIVSAISIVMFRYSSMDFSPLFMLTEWGWSTCHWICYPFCFTLIIVLRLLYNKFNIEKFKEYIIFCGKKSYEIFLWQMIYFVLPIKRLLDLLISNRVLSFVFYVIVSILVCTLPIVLIDSKIKVKIYK